MHSPLAKVTLRRCPLATESDDTTVLTPPVPKDGTNVLSGPLINAYRAPTCPYNLPVRLTLKLISLFREPPDLNGVQAGLALTWTPRGTVVNVVAVSEKVRIRESDSISPPTTLLIDSSPTGNTHRPAISTALQNRLLR